MKRERNTSGKGACWEHLLQLRAEPVDIVLQVARWLLALHHCYVGP